MYWPPAGGAYMDESTRAALRAGAFTIWLKVPLDVLLGRVRKRQAQDQSRPLLNNGDMRGTLERLLAVREPVYAQADMVLESVDAPHGEPGGQDCCRACPPWVMRSAMSERISVGLGDRAYDIHVGAGMLARAGELLKPLAKGVVPVVTDENVAALHLTPLLAALDAVGIKARAHRHAARRSQQEFRRPGKAVGRAAGAGRGPQGA